MLYHKNLLLSISFSEIGLGASEIALDWCKREGHCHKKIKHTKPRYPLGPFGLWCISTLHSRSFHLLIGSFSETSKTVCFHFVCPPFCEWLIRTRNPHGLKALAMCQWISKIWGAFELQSKNKESSPFCIESILGNLLKQTTNTLSDRVPVQPSRVAEVTWTTSAKRFGLRRKF